MSEPRVSSAPLQGKRVLVTRTREQASALSVRLRDVGALPVEFPTIRIVPPSDWSDLDAALGRLYTNEWPGYHWLILTSANGVRICMERLRELGRDPTELLDVRIAAIGPATAAALEPYGLRADLVPAEYIAEGIMSALRADCKRRGVSLAGQCILLARAAEARKVLVTELRAAGALVHEVAAYTTVAASHDDEQGQRVLRQLRQGGLDIITFTSSSTVRNFCSWLKNCGEESEVVAQASELKIASIGPITSQTARELGLHVDVEAREFTIEGLVKALIEFEEKR